MSDYERGLRAGIELAAQVVVARGFRIPSLAKLADQIRALAPPDEPVSPMKAIAESLRDGTFVGIAPTAKPAEPCATCGVRDEGLGCHCVGGER